MTLKKILNILVIEDSPAQLEALLEFCRDIPATKFSDSTTCIFKIFGAADLSESRLVLQKEKIDLIISDLFLPDGTGIEFIKELYKEKHLNIPCIIATADSSIENAVEAIRNGAIDYILKPIDFNLLKHKIIDILETQYLRNENKTLRENLAQIRQSAQTNIIGNSQNIQEIYQQIKQIHDTDITVLLEGESGTGKQVFANLIYETSNRKNKQFIQVNCGALVKTLLEAELFGVVKGAYTGADKSRAGYLETASGGTIFLDEIGEMDMESQIRLLRALEERKITRIGSTDTIDVDIRIVAATNKNLLEQVANGKFREDLYYRLAVMKIHLPPLRERKEDIPLFFNYFAVKFNEKYNKSVTTLSPQLLNFLYSYHWPGNIRQFSNILERMIVLVREDILTFEDLPLEFRNQHKSNGLSQSLNYNIKKLKDSIIPQIPLHEYEKAIIAKNLEAFSNNRTKTAESLAISTRNIYRKIKEYNL